MGKRLEFYAYNPPTCGAFTINGFEYRYGEDFRNVKRYKEYLDCGFTMLQVRYENAYNGEPWEQSNAKKVCDEAYRAGVKKLLITDLRIDALIKNEDIVGEDKIFKTEEELDRRLKELVAVYKDVPAFYGIQLKDEPKLNQLKAYGRIARALKRVLPNIYLQCNLLPFGGMASGVPDTYDVYRNYIETYFKETDNPHVCMDEYPFRREYILSGNIVRGYQIIAEVCKKLGKEFHTVLQSFANISEGIYRCRRVNESDMYWQTNAATGFGVRQYAFYTYMPKCDISYKNGAGDGIDGACFLNGDGSKTALYFYTKRIISEMKTFSRIALNYDYERYYIVAESGKTKNDFEWTETAVVDDSTPFPISVDKGVALITEQRNGDDRLFMIENFGNVKDELFCGAPPMKVEFSLPDGKKSFYFRGKRIKCENANGKFVRELKVGDAVFIEIKK